ncbi:hypothetical protein O6P43_030640 [Quillaja saponaria]|uniref:Uncharacterized protein n=1 Tax=Quillaja saponaria TaxID=32244 RepID=A0AAD7KV09_QUISA|nr:hypothetical protein O6P43_030640 [Quillaja saponaria]
MKPEGGCVEAFLVGLAGATHAAEITDQLESGQGVVGPCQLEPLSKRVRWCVGDYMEKEIEAGITGGKIGGGAVFSVSHGRLRTGLNSVEIGDHLVHERISGSRWCL